MDWYPSGVYSAVAVADRILSGAVKRRQGKPRFQRQLSGNAIWRVAGREGRSLYYRQPGTTLWWMVVGTWMEVDI